MTAADLARGFQFEGQRIPLINPQRGIFKPQAMRYALSIKTVAPKKGARVWYDDQRTAQTQSSRALQRRRWPGIQLTFKGSDPTSYARSTLNGRNSSIGRATSSFQCRDIGRSPSM